MLNFFCNFSVNILKKSACRKQKNAVKPLNNTFYDENQSFGAFKHPDAYRKIVNYEA